MHEGKKNKEDDEQGHADGNEKGPGVETFVWVCSRCVDSLSGIDGTHIHVGCRARVQGGAVQKSAWGSG